MSSDVFVYLDTVQFSKNGLQNRNQIKTAQGPGWLTIPVQQSLGQTIIQTQAADSSIFRKHFRTLEMNYAGSPGFKLWKGELEALLMSCSTSLVDAAIDTTEWMLSKLNIGSRRLRASELQGIGGKASELVASICGSLGATFYLSGSGALSYLETKD